MKIFRNITIILLTSFLCISCSDYVPKRLLKSSKEEDMAQGAKYAIDHNLSDPMYAFLLTDVLRRSKSSETKLYAIKALKIKYEYAFSAIPFVIPCLQDKDQDVVCNAADLLGMITYNSNKAVPALLDALAKNKEKIEVRLHIIKALGEIGPGAISAVPILKENLKSTDHLIIIETRNSLGHILREQSYILPCEMTSVGGKKVKELPMDLDTIYFDQDKSAIITALFEKKKFPDILTFYIYLRNNINSLKNKKILIIYKRQTLDLEIGAIIKLFLDNDIPVYGKCKFFGNIKYSSYTIKKYDNKN